jgi:hypothetical protein
VLLDASYAPASGLFTAIMLRLSNQKSVLAAAKWSAGLQQRQFASYECREERIY